MTIQIQKRFGHALLFAACLTTVLAAWADEPAPGRPGAEQYVLLTDGRLIRGVVARDDAGYSITQKIGVIRYPSNRVERAFGTVEEAFRYRLERIPEDDPAERLRLARWCMSWHLDQQAKLLLEQVIEISPDHGPARAMLASMKQTEANRLARNEAKVDESLRQTSGDVEEDRARALDSAVLRDAGRKLGISGLPVIFDLPPAMAVQKAEQFTRYVHPILQVYCAHCHNPGYDGEFQLVPVKKGRRPSPDAVRANLDATLRLVDPDAPIKSELLSSTLRPHGNTAKPHPIFKGSNDQAYQVLAAWVTSLRPRGYDEPQPARRGAGSDGEVFAAGRMRRAAEAAGPIARDRNPEAEMSRILGYPVPPAVGPGGKTYRYVEGKGMVPEEPSEADPREFPLPYMMGGPRPVLPGASGSKRAATDQAPTSDPGDLPPLDGVDGTPTKPAGTAKPKAAGVPDRPATKKKPVKLDPRLLESLLKQNAGRTDGP